MQPSDAKSTMPDNASPDFRHCTEAELRQRFPSLQRDEIYLNHAAMGPWCSDSHAAVSQFADENLHCGAWNYAQWMQLEEQLHRQLADFIGVHERDDIALVKNTSEGLSLIAQGINWAAGDEIVIPDLEFPSNRLCWWQQQHRGALLREVHLAAAEPEQALMAACTERTRLMSVSAVQYGAGLRLDLERLGQFCRERGILFCVDGIQQLGALQLNALTIQCDFLVADAHKWLLGPEGIALFYSTAEARSQLNQDQIGWRMYPDPFNFERSDWTPPASARRFEIGSPNMLGIFAFAAALRMFQDYGMAQVEQRLLANMAVLFERLAQIPGIELRSHADPAYRSGIINFAPRPKTGLTSAQLHRRLLQAGIFGAQRGPGIRWSPHFYQSPAQMQRAVELLEQCLRSAD